MDNSGSEWVARSEEIKYELIKTAPVQRLAQEYLLKQRGAAGWKKIEP
ncbi:hypothetical protein FFU48_05140 [Vibrio cholerae]|nr:hypothetical protein [Vibrio cholerae]EGR0610099.1 hypothetical protein [Vibrio cholerae]